MKSCSPDLSFCGKSESFLRLSPIHFKRLQPKRRSESPVSQVSSMPTQSYIAPLNLCLTSESTTPIDDLYVRTERDCYELEKAVMHCKRPSRRRNTTHWSMKGRSLQLSGEALESIRQSISNVDEGTRVVEVHDEETLCALFRHATENLRTPRRTGPPS
jgi:hypothetical protein